jgi:hypothetical protein
MSSSRLRYDTCASEHDLHRSLGPGMYAIDTPQVSMCGAQQSACFVQDPALRLGSGPALKCGYSGQLVDVDSELLGITRKASRCPQQRYLPFALQPPLCTLPQDCPPDIRNFLASEDTRLSNPGCTMRCRGWNRWEWLCKDPQSGVLPQFPHNINYRIVVKDNHRPCIEEPIDQSAGMPCQHAPRPAVLDDWMMTCVEEDGGGAGVPPSVTWPSCSRFY